MSVSYTHLEGNGLVGLISILISRSGEDEFLSSKGVDGVLDGLGGIQDLGLGSLGVVEQGLAVFHGGGQGCIGIDVYKRQVTVLPSSLTRSVCLM